MDKSELVKISPLRILEKSIQGGLQAGNIGVIASEKGVGKTACLVQIAIDKLLQDNAVIHVSFADRVERIISWYEDVFKEIEKKYRLETSSDFIQEALKKRIIINLKQEGTGRELMLKSLESMIVQGKFKAETVVVDGYDFSLSSREELSLIRNFGRSLGIEFWFSASLKEEKPLFDEAGMPLMLKGLKDEVAVLIILDFEDNHIWLKLVKCHDLPLPPQLELGLDPRTLIIGRKR
ncbi:MAG: hypothetical protein ACE5LC_09740 [Candidatus Aminicenantales bacterium]